jgi:hypothetical protein
MCIRLCDKGRPGRAGSKAFQDSERLVEWVAGREGGRGLPQNVVINKQIHRLVGLLFFCFRLMHCPYNLHVERVATK